MKRPALETSELPHRLIPGVGQHELRNRSLPLPLLVVVEGQTMFEDQQRLGHGAEIGSHGGHEHCVAGSVHRCIERVTCAAAIPRRQSFGGFSDPDRSVVSIHLNVNAWSRPEFLACLGKPVEPLPLQRQGLHGRRVSQAPRAEGRLIRRLRARDDLLGRPELAGRPF